MGANAPQYLGANLLAIIAAAIGSAFVAVTIYLCYGYADRLAICSARLTSALAFAPRRRNFLSNSGQVF
jgi:hypothetical protein